ncbi:MAG: radical SAM protein, partial [bacterium]|nr:radical SAM protein [bacterium]
LKKYAEGILEFCKQGVLKELHIGLQHVNNEMLTRMGRPVDFSPVYEIIRKINRECPGFYFVGDIMVGFPGETDEIFEELIEFFKKDTSFDKIKHFGYSEVTGAPSAQFENPVPPDVITARWDRLDKVLGDRAYSDEDNETRIDNETFRITRFEDYTFCIGTFDEPLDHSVTGKPLTEAESTVLKKDGGEFGF